MNSFVCRIIREVVEPLGTFGNRHQNGSVRRSIKSVCGGGGRQRRVTLQVCYKFFLFILFFFLSRELSRSSAMSTRVSPRLCVRVLTVRDRDQSSLILFVPRSRRAEPRALHTRRIRQRSSPQRQSLKLLMHFYLCTHKYRSDIGTTRWSMTVSFLLFSVYFSTKI